MTDKFAAKVIKKTEYGTDERKWSEIRIGTLNFVFPERIILIPMLSDHSCLSLLKIDKPWHA